MGFKQIEKSVNSSIDNSSNGEISTAIADKTHLANLITSLKSELASANALLKTKENDCHYLNNQLECKEKELVENKKRLNQLEIQCENYRETVSNNFEILCEFLKGDNKLVFRIYVCV